MLLNEKLMLEENLSRLNTQIHNSIKGKIDSSINLMNLYFQKNKNNNPIELNIINNLLNHCSNESKNLLFVINQKECDLNTLYNELESKMKLQLSFSNINYHIHKKLNLSNHTIIEAKIVQSCLDIFSELLNNIIKHSKAENVNVSLEYLNDTLKLIVEDDGLGFDYQEAKNIKGSYGIKIIEKLSQQMNGNIIFDFPERGTKVYVEFRINSENKNSPIVEK